MASYWQRQLSRRTALRLGGGAALGASGLFLLACGGGGSSGSGGSRGEELQGKIAVPKDTTSSAKRGGVYQSVVNTDETNLGPFTTTRGAGSGGVEKDAYQKLLREKEFAGGTKTQVFEGDAVES